MDRIAQIEQECSIVDYSFLKYMDMIWFDDVWTLSILRQKKEIKAFSQYKYAKTSSKCQVGNVLSKHQD